MTVIAWDGSPRLVADKQMTIADSRFPTVKLHRGPRGEVYGFTGDPFLCMARMEWLKNGGEPSEYPKAEGDAFARLLVLDASGLSYFESSPYRIQVYSPFMAFGSGMDFAIAAMAMGADAVRAVEIACQFDTGCGMGIDVMEFESAL
jgi:hypothetical protein